MTKDFFGLPVCLIVIKKPAVVVEKFNTYRFADYKEQVIDLLMRVCTVSAETMKIVKEMPA